MLDIRFHDQRFALSILASSYVTNSKTVKGRTLPLPTHEVACGLSIAIFTFDLALSILKVKVKVMHIWTVNLSQMVMDRANIAIANKQKVTTTFLEADLDLTLIHSKEHDQVHAHFECE